MAFQLIDLENWERREFYEHFIKDVVCTYSAVVNLDITNLKGQKLYPAMIWERSWRSCRAISISFN